MEKFLNKWEILITIIISITSIFLAIKANEMTKIQTSDEAVKIIYDKIGLDKKKIKKLLKANDK